MPAKRNDSRPCSKCGECPPTVSFRVNKTTGYRDAWCRGCTRDSTKSWKARNPEPVRRSNRESDRRRYWADPQAARERGIAGYHANAEVWMERARKRPSEKKRAAWRIHELTRSGRLQRPDSCQQCGESGQRIEAHHPDYSRPEHVEWLCTRCHGATRRRQA